MASRSLLSTAIVAGALVLCADSFAHDYWIQPASLDVRDHSSLPVRLFVGTKGSIKEHPYKASFSVRFEVHSGEGVKPIAGKNYYRPAGTLNTQAAGIYTLVFESRHDFIELPPAKFETYLSKEGLDFIIRERKRRGESSSPGRESFRRSCKALVRVGGGSSGFDRVVGLPFEVTARDNPFAKKAGEYLSFALTLDGKPLAGALVELMSLDDLSVAASGTTNARGVVKLRVPAAGRWMVASTHMRRAALPVKGDWESLWSTLVFEVPNAP